jgi:uncharacterized protein YbaP (TraB family)
MKKGMYLDSRTLADDISKAQYAKVKQRCEALGIPEVAFVRLKPWCLMMTLTALNYMELGYRPELGIDRHFYGKALSAGKEIRVLESLEQQLDILAGLSEEEQRYFLDQVLIDTAELRQQMERVFAAWRQGDSDELARLFLEARGDGADSKAFYERINFARNRAWLAPIIDFLSMKVDVLVIVGALHLAGEGSLVDLLTDAGYKIEQM